MKISKKCISVFLSLVMLISVTVPIDLSVSAEDTSSGTGNDISSNYIDGYIAIKDKYDFADIAENPSGKYYLADDIVFAEEDFVYGEDFYGFEALDTFSGVFDGCGHSINGIESDCAIAVKNTGVIKNLSINNSEFTSGAVCEQNDGTIENCTLESSIADGIVYKNNGKISYCISTDNDCGICYNNFSNGVITHCINNSDLSNVSGIVGDANHGEISYCINNGDITSYSGSDLGGICSRCTSVYYTDDYAIVKNCINNGDIYARRAGGICQCIYYGKIVNCLNTGDVYATNSIGGGVIYGPTKFSSGIAEIHSGKQVICCMNTGSVNSGSGAAVALIIDGETGSIIDSYYLEGVGKDNYCEIAYGQEGAKPVTLEDINKESSYPKFNFNNDWCVTENGLSLQFTDKKQIATLIYQMPSKTYYKIGEELDVSDMLVMTCDNYGDWRITDDFTVSGFTGALGKNTVTVTAGDCSASFNVYVQDYITNSKITLNATKFTATGKAIKPTVKVISKDGRVLKINTDYTLSYSSNTYPGTGYVTITGKGMYIGSVKKSFIIIPAQVKSLKVSTRKTTSLKLSWTKQSGVTGYEVQKYDSSKKAWKTYKTITSNTNSVTVSKLTPSTVYKFRVRSYKTISGKKYYGSYSSTLTTPTTPSTVKVKSSIIYENDVAEAKYSLKWNKSKNVTGYQIQAYGFGYYNGKWCNHWKTITTIKGASKTSYTSKWRFDFESATKLRIRPYKEVNGKKYYGAWTTPKTKHKYK